VSKSRKALYTVVAFGWRFHLGKFVANASLCCVFSCVRKTSTFCKKWLAVADHDLQESSDPARLYRYYEAPEQWRPCRSSAQLVRTRFADSQFPSACPSFGSFDNCCELTEPTRTAIREAYTGESQTALFESDADSVADQEGPVEVALAAVLAYNFAPF
jgi:hypothetical protein